MYNKSVEYKSVDHWQKNENLNLPLKTDMTEEQLKTNISNSNEPCAQKRQFHQSAAAATWDVRAKRCFALNCQRYISIWRRTTGGCKAASASARGGANVSPSTALAGTLTSEGPRHRESQGRRRGLKEFIADLIPCDLKLASADQSCYVLHVVKLSNKKHTRWWIPHARREPSTNIYFWLNVTCTSRQSWNWSKHH